MIYIFHANNELMSLLAKADNERTLVTTVVENLHLYSLATRVKQSELDIAFAATGGPTAWINVDNITVEFEPKPARGSSYGDVLVEIQTGYVNLSTPAGFIPLIDVIERNGILQKKQLN